MPSRRPTSDEPSLLVAIWWLFLAACAVVAFIIGVNFVLTAGDDQPSTPAPSAPAAAPSWEPPAQTPLPDTDEDDWLTAYPSGCANGTPLASPWDPCGNLP